MVLLFYTIERERKKLKLHYLFQSTNIDGTGYIVDIGLSSSYWTNGASSTSCARYLSIYSNDIRPQNAFYRSFGFSVRSVKE